MNYREHKLYWVFRAMLKRCTKQNNKDYKNYGARGISVEFESYKDFIDWALINGYRDGLEIDRRDNDGNYSKDNCRFVTKSLNNKNRRCTSKLGFRGVTIQKSGIKKYKARLGSKSLGYYMTAVEAARAYNAYIIVNNLDNALNKVETVNSITGKENTP